MMTLTRDEKVARLLELPWTVRTGQDALKQEHLAWVLELPDLCAAAPRDGHELMEALRASIRRNLRIRLYFGDEIPLPAGCRLPWDDAAHH